MLRFLTSGESHGQGLIAIVDGLPSGLKLDVRAISAEMHKRQQGYGRGSRQKIERDEAEIISGVRHGTTTGAPVALLIKNRDFENWRYVMSPVPLDLESDEAKEQLAKKAIGKFRPGHADLAGSIKFHQKDIRDVLERASARETAARVAVGAVCGQLLAQLGIHFVSHVVAVGPVHLPEGKLDSDLIELSELQSLAESSEMFCAHEETSESMKSYVKKAWQDGDSVGGIVEVVAEGIPVGIGSYTQWDCRLDGQIAQAVMSIQAIKAVEIGDGARGATLPGSLVHDALYPADSDSSNGLPFQRKTNHAGGIEGGMSNGSRLKVRAFMKPIPTMRRGLESISFPDLAADTAHYERSDVCAVPAASVVVKAMLSFVVARAMLDKFGGDSMDDLLQAVDRYRLYCKSPFQSIQGADPDKVLEMELE